MSPVFSRHILQIAISSQNRGSYRDLNVRTRTRRRDVRPRQHSAKPTVPEPTLMADSTCLDLKPLPRRFQVTASRQEDIWQESTAENALAFATRQRRRIRPAPFLGPSNQTLPVGKIVFLGKSIDESSYCRLKFGANNTRKVQIISQLNSTTGCRALGDPCPP